MPDIQENHQLQLAFKFIRDTHQNVFLTGKAGTGKTTFLKRIQQNCSKRMVIVAPTGVAALNAGGTTIHSLFQLPFSPFIPGQKTQQQPIHRFTKNKIALIRSIDLLIIDEISMVRADLLDAIDNVLRRFRDHSMPFGGLQLLMVGDLQQLAPVVKQDEELLLKNFYPNNYFFSSKALKTSGFISIELKTIYRQEDDTFIQLLNKIRNNQLDPITLQQLNKRYIPKFKPANNELWITLTTHHYRADQLNEKQIAKLDTHEKTYKGELKGNFPDYLLPTELELKLKEGAQVMFIQNDYQPEKRYYNGKIGQITNLEKNQIEISCPGESLPIIIQPSEWKNTRYQLNAETNQLEEEILGSFVQFPLRLAWAITIHKSQGLTFDKAILDISQSFAPGQIYVAISRCRTLEGMILSQPIQANNLHIDQEIQRFSAQLKDPGDQELLEAKISYQTELLCHLFNFTPLLQPIHYLLKVFTDSQLVLSGNIQTITEQLKSFIFTQVEPVASKFRVQLTKIIQSNHLLPTEDEFLQERVRKATHYFTEQFIQRFSQLISEIQFQTDNKKYQKTINTGLEQLNLQFSIKRYCLESCLNDFDPEQVLKAQSKAIGEQLQKTEPVETSQNLSDNPEIYRQLNQWRYQKAKEEKVTITRILPQKTLLTIANELPVTVNQLKAIKGMGGKKLQHYGKYILEQLIAYCQLKGISLPDSVEQEPQMAEMDTKMISFFLFKQGKNIQGIAEKREMSTATIENHLAYFVEAGELDASKLFSKADFKELIKILEANSSDSAAELKSKLGKQFSYGAINIGRAHLQAQKTK